MLEIRLDIKLVFDNTENVSMDRIVTILEDAIDFCAQNGMLTGMEEHTLADYEVSVGGPDDDRDQLE